MESGSCMRKNIYKLYEKVLQGKVKYIEELQHERSKYSSHRKEKLQKQLESTGFVGVDDDKLIKTLKEILKTELHHIKHIVTKDDKIVDVVWSPSWLNYDMQTPGGRLVQHHTCRKCKRVALHLLGVPMTPNRWCLECDGYKNVPLWYYQSLNTSNKEKS